MREIVFLGLNNPQALFNIILHVVIMVMAFYTLEAIDYAKILRPERRHKAPMLHIFLSIALGYMVSQFILVLLFR